MMARIVQAKPLDGYKIYLRFDDGAEGVVDIASAVEFKGVFAALRNRAFFKQVRVLPDFGTICWPNDVDLDPDVLYWRVTGVAPWKMVERARAAGNRSGHPRAGSRGAVRARLKRARHPR